MSEWFSMTGAIKHIYIGMVPLIVIPFALPLLKKRDPLLTFLFVILGFCLIYTFTPFVKILASWIPSEIIRAIFFRAEGERFSHFYIYVSALITAYGLTGIIRRDRFVLQVAPKILRWERIILFCFTLAIVFGLAIFTVINIKFTDRLEARFAGRIASQLQGSFPERKITEQDEFVREYAVKSRERIQQVFSFRNPFWYKRIFLLGLPIFAIGWYLSGRIGIKTLTLLLGIVMMTDVWDVSHGMVSESTQRYDQQFRQFGNADQLELVAFLKKDPELFRIIISEDDDQYIFPFQCKQELLPHNFFYRHDITTFGVKTNIYPYSIQQIYNAIEETSEVIIVQHPSFSKTTSPLFKYFNVKYVLTSPRKALPKAYFTMVFNNQAYRVWQFRQYQQRAYLADRVVISTDDNRIIAAMNKNTDPFTVFTNDPKLLFSDNSYNQSQDNVTIVQYQPEQIRLNVNAQSERLLVLADLFYPGWVATVNSQPTTIYRVNFMCRAILVPAGSSQVEFRYPGTIFKHGLIISLTSLAVACFLWIILRRLSFGNNRP